MKESDLPLGHKWRNPHHRRRLLRAALAAHRYRVNMEKMRTGAIQYWVGYDPLWNEPRFVRMGPDGPHL